MVAGAETSLFSTEIELTNGAIVQGGWCFQRDICDHLFVE